MKSVGLLFLIAGVIAAMGTLFHVNDVWLYGPYDSAAATSYSQPDWYIGFLEGSLRLFPPLEIRIGRFMINNLVFSAMLIPGVIFGGLFLVPWIERRCTGDTAEHHLLDRPRDRPGRTAAGAASITFVTVLFLGGSQDVIAGTFDISIGRITAVLQIAAIVAPPIVGYVTYRRLPGAPRRGPAPERTERAGAIARLPDGGYEAADRDEADARRPPDASGPLERCSRDRRGRHAAHRAGPRHRRASGTASC